MSREPDQKQSRPDRGLGGVAYCWGDPWMAEGQLLLPRSFALPPPPPPPLLQHLVEDDEIKQLTEVGTEDAD